MDRMDDIDDLLDEVEREFKSKELSSVKITNARSSRPEMDSKNRKVQHKSSEIEDAIDSILDQDGEFERRKLPQKTAVVQNVENAGVTNLKCYPVYLGGIRTEKGQSTIGHKKACSNLRCTSCDFKVVTFDNRQWKDSVDYLFFRNNMPDKSKLQAKLCKSAGTISYCCQCSWKNVKEMSLVNKFKDVKWVCGKH